MNSDPYDSAAWKTFGMLDADENAIFNDAMRDDPALRTYSLELDRLSAAVAASTAIPVDHGTEPIESIRRRLKLNPAMRAGRLFALAGWGAAAVLAIALILSRSGRSDASATQSKAVTSGTGKPAATPKPTSKVVAKRLSQEIEVLRGNLEKFQHRDQALFAPVPGMAMPVVMTMTPPGVPATESPITTMLGDAVRVSTVETEIDNSGFPEPPPAVPSAMSIYDSARDLGTIVVTDLPEAAEDEAYNLWVTTESGGQPIYVGSLPESIANGAESFDFSLGSTLILPSGFIITLDPTDASPSPNENNIVLQGPPPAK